MLYRKVYQISGVSGTILGEIDTMEAILIERVISPIALVVAFSIRLLMLQAIDPIKNVLREWVK